MRAQVCQSSAAIEINERTMSTVLLERKVFFIMKVKTGHRKNKKNMKTSNQRD